MRKWFLALCLALSPGAGLFLEHHVDPAPPTPPAQVALPPQPFFGAQQLVLFVFAPGSALLGLAFVILVRSLEARQMERQGRWQDLEVGPQSVSARNLHGFTMVLPWFYPTFFFCFLSLLEFRGLIKDIQVGGCGTGA